MKQITLEVQEEKYQFFLELIQSFDFVSIATNRKQQEVIASIARGMKEADLAAKGKIKSKSAKALINAL